MCRAAAPHSRIGWMKWRRLREPSVFWLPYFFSSPGDCTTFTRDQSASSSSATAIGRLVRDPVPISARCETIVTRPLGSIETKTCGSLTTPPGILAAPVAKTASAPRAGTNSAATTRPPVAIKPRRNPRRLTFSTVAWTAAMSRSCGGRLDGGGDALIAAATADVAAHLAVDLVLGRVLVGGEQRGGLHDLAGLAIPALRDIQGAPCFLHRVIALRVEPLDRGHRPTRDIVDGGDAGASRLAVEMNGARPAQRHAAAILCSGEPQLVSQIPQQRHRRIAVEGLLLAVDAQLDHSVPPRVVPIAGLYLRRSGPGNIVNQRG